ncbi:MAG: L-seryl-tRNA(Sec) selenium transferase [Nitrospinae bacterium]|nr:L-seryl-tRNA(Sec) selenium transferase [Nitrospinota bacterium]
MTSPDARNLQSKLLRLLPSVDEIVTRLKDDGVNGSSDTALSDAVRKAIGTRRQLLLEQMSQDFPKTTENASLSEQTIRDIVLDEAKQILSSNKQLGLKKVINATGIVLHTNLGRAPLSEAARAALNNMAQGYSNLEFDLHLGKRGKRGSDVESLLCQLSGAESALVVNNNAAAVMFAIHTMANAAEVIVSRGELVEIGGSFRIPDIMRQSGARLVEVGTTNKTRISDYRNAITQDTALLLKAHTSNYRIVGFTEEASRDELSELSKETSIPTLEDLGSGSLLHVDGLPHEPTVIESIQAGIDVVTFSGDKLLGGPQAGIVVGKAIWVEKMKKHPLMRILRLDKLTLAALEATLRVYLDPDTAYTHIPTLQMLSTNREKLKKQAERLMNLMGKHTCSLLGARVEETSGMVGGGAMPLAKLDSFAVTLSPKNSSAKSLETKLRHGTPPVVARIHEDKVILDLRCIQEDEMYQLGVILNEFTN